MRALASKKHRSKRGVGNTRLSKGKPLSRRQRIARRLFHAIEARVATLPPFVVSGCSTVLIGAFIFYGAILGGQATDAVSRATAAVGFDVHAVTISGHRYMQERDILDILGLEPGTSLVTFDVRQAQQTLLREPLIEEAAVRKIYPGKLEIKISEHVPFAVWQRGRIVSVVDRDGLVVDTFDKELHGDLPNLVGHGAQRQGADFLAMMGEFPALQSRLRASMLHSERRWDILLDNAVTVKLPEQDVRDALALLLQLEEEEAILSKDLLSIDMRLKDRLVMRLSDEAMVNRQATLKKRKEARSEEKKI